MFVTGQPFLPFLIYVGKARAQGEAPEWLFTEVGSGLTCKHLTRLEMLAMDNHYSLLPKIVNYLKRYVTLASGVNIIKLFFLLG